MANDDNLSWWRNNTIGSLQGASAATKREKLEKALARHDAAVARLGPHAYDDAIHVVVDAARKHLETLPKPVWRVTGWLPASADRAAPFETTSREAALDFARDYLKQGMAHVSVYQVPS